jgi:hypothetical protein
VRLVTFDRAVGNHLNSVVSLYDSEALHPFYPLSYTAPPFDPQQHRLLAQVDTSASQTPGYIDR